MNDDYNNSNPNPYGTPQPQNDYRPQDTNQQPQQNPYGQSPYSYQSQQQNSYGQSPYSYQPQQNPYGQPQYNPQYNQFKQEEPKKKIGFAITSMVLGIIMFLGGCCFLYGAVIAETNALLVIPVLLCILGVVLGIISLSKQYKGKGMAITGIILNAISFLSVGLMLFYFVLTDIRLAAFGYPYTYTELLKESVIEETISEEEYDRIIETIYE